MEHKEINWNDFPVHKKRGSCCIKEEYEDEETKSLRTHWVVDNNIPIFRNEDREYVDRLINFE